MALPYLYRMTPEIQDYNQSLSSEEQEICNHLAQEINQNLSEAESKIWHGHPVWFLEENPIVGYSQQKKGIRLMFWSGASFEEEELNVRGPKFKDASVFYTHLDQINNSNLQKWLRKSRDIQWDYKNIVKRKGILERLK